MHTVPTNGPCDVIAWHPSKMILAYAAEELEGGRASGAFRLYGMV